MECYSAVKKKEILLFARTWMDVEDIMVIEIRHRKTNNCLTHSDVDSQKMQIIASESRMLVAKGWG